jgi:hypothetical protein
MVLIFPDMAGNLNRRPTYKTRRFFSAPRPERGQWRFDPGVQFRASPGAQRLARLTLGSLQ